MPVAVSVVLPLQRDPHALLDVVGLLADRWPTDVEAELLVPTRPLSVRDRALLSALEGDVRLVETSERTLSFGELTQAGARAATGPRALVLDESGCPSAAALDSAARSDEGTAALTLAIGVLADTPVLGSAMDLRSLRALAAALRPLPERPALRPAPELPPSPRTPGLLSVVVPSRSCASLLGTCLDAVQRSTRRPYEVVVVDVASTDGTKGALAGRRHVRVVPAPAGTGYDAALNLGIASSRGEFVALLDPATVVHRFWADALLGPLEQDDTVSVTGPRANTGPGLQGVPPAGYRSLAAWQQRAEQWRRDHRGERRDVERVAGPCVVLRAASLGVVGLLPEQLDHPVGALTLLCARLREAGGQAVLVDEVLVHQEQQVRWPSPDGLGSDEAPALRAALREHGAPLLSATLIVKDEQRALAVCLASVASLVDEVVVSDTGSSDRTVEIAQAMGARVVHRAWTDDFAAARNHAHEAATATWALTLDADEQLVPGPDAYAELTGLLLTTASDGLAAPLRHLGSPGAVGDVEHMTVRLLRRGVLRWRGSVHETPVRLDGARPRVEGVSCLRVEHDGYAAEVFSDKAKGDRNLALARRERERTTVEDGGRWRWKGAYELARALLTQAGDDAEVEDLLRECVAGMPVTSPHLRADARVRLAELLLRTDRAHEAEDHAREALALLPGDARACLTLATVLVASGRPAEALALLERFRPGTGPGTGEMRDVRCEQVQLPTLRARLLLDAGRSTEAAELLTGLAGSAAEDFAAWELLGDALRREHGDRADHVLGTVLAPVAATALRALRGLAPDRLRQVHAGLRAAGVDPDIHTPEAVEAREIEQALLGHSPEAVRTAALALEDDNPSRALELWRRLPRTTAVQVGQARCLVALDRLPDAVVALDGVVPQELQPAETLVVAAVAAAAGDVATATALLRSLPAVEVDLAQEAVALARLLGEPAVDALPPHVLEPVLAR